MNSRRRKKMNLSVRSGRHTVKEKSCGIILFRRNGLEREYLLLHYPGGHWDYPKGHIEEIDNSEKETARRELEEETGITDIEFVKGYREPMYYTFSRGKSEVVKKTVVYFLAEAKHLEVKISFEHQDFIWLPFAEALEKLTFENARDLMKLAESKLKIMEDFQSNK